MEQLLRLGVRNGKAIVLIAILVAIGLAFAHVSGLTPEQQEELLWTVQNFLPILMFVTLAVLLFTGFPVAFILGGLSLLYGLIGYFLGSFSLIEFFNFLPRIWGQAAENLVLVAVPAFVFMGVMMERSGVANDLLYCVQVLLIEFYIYRQCFVQFGWQGPAAQSFAVIDYLWMRVQQIG